MKTILVATDFSKAGHNACVYAGELAQAFNARLILFTAYQQVPVPVPEAPVVITPDDMRVITREEIENERKGIGSLKTINIETRYEEGEAVHNILKVAREAGADLIITGMKAAGKGFRKIIGSTVTALIRKSKVPVLVVPEGAVYARINSIALANESDLTPDTDVHVTDALRDITDRFHAQLYVVRVAKDQFKEAFDVLNPPSILLRAMRPSDPVYKCILEKDVYEGLNGFVKQYRIDVLAMLAHKHSLLERWFGKSATRSMAFATPIPLLILPDPLNR